MSGRRRAGRNATRLILSLFAVAAVSCFDQSLPLQAQQATPFHRGIGVSHLLAWADVEDDGVTFSFPPFSGADRAFSSSEYRSLKASGLDFVRLAVDPGPLIQFEGAKREAVEQKVRETVNSLLDAGLAVIVDLHPSDRNAAFASQALTTGADTPAFAAYLALVARMAENFAALRSDRIALELMNEPTVSNTIWIPMLEAAYRKARAAAPDLVLVVGGGTFNSADELNAIDGTNFAGDPAVIFTFHYYDPIAFTHQGAPWMDAGQLQAVPYPPTITGIRESLEATTRSIQSGKLTSAEQLGALSYAAKELNGYLASGFDRSTIAGTFDNVGAWSDRYGIARSRILLGEFGARLTPYAALTADRIQWLRDVREEAERHGFIWSVWAYKGDGGFALARTSSDGSIEPEVSTALGLAPQ